MLDDDSSISHPALERAAPLRAMRPDHAAVMRVRRGDNRGAKARHYRSASAKYRDQWPAGPDVIAPSSRFDKYGRSERYQGAAYALASLYRSLAAAQPFIRAWWRSEAPAEGTVIVTISEVASTVRIVFRICHLHRSKERELRLSTPQVAAFVLPFAADMGPRLAVAIKLRVINFNRA